jgi:hypothetical protein
MCDGLSTRWNPVRLQVARRSLVETTASTIATLPVGYAEVHGALVMPKEGVRLQLVQGEVERLIKAGDIRSL